MTTTISKLDFQQQQLQQQLLQQPTVLQQQQQQQNSTILLRSSANKNLFRHNTVNIITNNATTTARLNSATTTTATAATAATIIQIDSLNNNSALITTTTTTTANSLTPTNQLVDLTTGHSPTALNNNNGSVVLDSSEIEPTTAQAPKLQKRRSLLNFKSFDFHIKSLYTGLRNGNKNSQSQSSSIDCANANGSGSIVVVDTPTTRTAAATGIVNRRPPYLKIDSVDTEESENLLLDYPQSPYSSRRNSSHDDNRSSSQLLHINNRYELSSRSQASSPSPYFLSPYVDGGGSGSDKIRRSSTSDIMSCKRSGTSSASDSRRPSTSDLLRRARERRGSEARMGRSVSHGGLPRGGSRSGCGGSGPSKGGGGRRTSMAF